MYANRNNPYWFGKNWSNFAPKIDETRLGVAIESIKEITGLESLAGKTFLDIGSGSGLFSLAALKLGAEKVTSFDVDPQSIAATTATKLRFVNDNKCWEIVEGSILNRNDVIRLPISDIVYSWGVLHHTGDMWEAIENASSRVAPSGCFCLGIFNSAGFKSDLVKLAAWISHKTPKNLFWVTAIPIIGAGVIRNFVLDTLKGRPFDRYSSYYKMRGMSYWHDLFDGLASYPYEHASPEQTNEFMARLGFSAEYSRVYPRKTLVNDYRFRNNLTI